MVAAQALAANDMVSTQRQPLNTAWGHFFVFARKTDWIRHFRCKSNERMRQTLARLVSPRIGTWNLKPLFKLLNTQMDIIFGETEVVRRCLTCKVHPKTPIMIMAMHRYSVKTSHHGFSSRNLEFCSVPKFRNSPTEIILAAASGWWQKGADNSEANALFQWRSTKSATSLKFRKITIKSHVPWSLVTTDFTTQHE